MILLFTGNEIIDMSGMRLTSFPILYRDAYTLNLIDFNDEVVKNLGTISNSTIENTVLLGTIFNAINNQARTRAIVCIDYQELINQYTGG